MIAGDEIPDLPSYVEPGSIHVRAPTPVVFICGGQVKPNLPKPASLRDALMRVIHKTPLGKYRVIQAEEVEMYFPNGEYVELLKFESDIAQISELLLLFSESAGSLAEMGVFVMDDEVAPRMMVVVDDKSYKSDSFIKLGPLFTLKLKYGDASVCVLTLSDINLFDIRAVADVDLEKFADALGAPLKHRLNVNPEPRTFDRQRSGHVTKLITGLVQHYSALTLDEIDILLYCLEYPVPIVEIKKHLLCAKAFDWILEEKRGIVTYYAAIADKPAFDFKTISGMPKPDMVRWRTDILQYWRSEDKERFKAIGNAASKATS